jgi:hypothetical protein
MSMGAKGSSLPRSRERVLPGRLMVTTRRTFLASTAALPVVGLATKVEGLVPPTEAATPPLRPAYPFKWWFSYDGELYQDECNSKEEALQRLADYGEGLIAECQRKDYDLDIGGDSIIEMLHGQNEEAVGEGEFLDGVTSEQVRDLGKMVSDTIEHWVQKHKIDTTAWSFGAVRNKISHG